MKTYLFFLLFFPSAFCSLKIIPISEIYNLTSSDNFLCCSESQNDSINIFYDLSNIDYRYIYDQNEEFISRIKMKPTAVLKVGFFKSGEGYLRLNKPLFLSPFLYYINEKEKENIHMEIPNSNNFIILKNDDFIGINHKASLRHLSFSLELFYYSRPPELKKIFSISLPDVYVKYYEMIEISEVLFFSF